MIMMPSCPYFILSTPLSLNMWAYLLILAFAWGQARSKLGGVDTSILHHAFILIIIALWAVITHFGTILMPFLSYFTRITWRGRMPTAGILDPKRSKYERPILHNSKSPEKLQRIILEYIKNTGERINGRGALQEATSLGARPTPWARPWLVGPLAGLWPPPSTIWSHFP